LWTFGGIPWQVRYIDSFLLLTFGDSTKCQQQKTIYIAYLTGNSTKCQQQKTIYITYLTGNS
jgi:hypothetical protein